MTTITITLPDERLRALQQAAAQLKITPEELVRVSVEELLTLPVEEFQDAIDYVLAKNAELYRRLA
jgi:antitoxin FitA